MTTDTSEAGLEALIVAAMTGVAGGAREGELREEPVAYDVGWIQGDPCVDRPDTARPRAAARRCSTDSSVSNRPRR